MLENIRKEIVNKPENIIASVYLQLNAFLASCLKKKNILEEEKYSKGDWSWSKLFFIWALTEKFKASSLENKYLWRW